MSSKQNQGCGGCVTVEYSTEEKRELYTVDTEEVDRLKTAGSIGLMGILLQKLLK